MRDIGEFPYGGFVPDEAIKLGLQGIRERLVGQTRVVYEVVLTRYYVKTISLKYMLGKIGIKTFIRLFERARISFNTGDLFIIIARKI